MNYLTIILVIVGGVVGYFIGMARGRARRPDVFSAATPDEMEELRKEAFEALSERTEVRKNKTIAMIKQDCGELGATRNEVEALLGVSDDTAGKYLKELEAEGKIRKIENPGQEHRYILAK